MHLGPLSEAFDRPNGFAFSLLCKHQAGTHRLSCNENRTGPANAVLTTDMRSGLPALLADSIDKRPARFHLDMMVTAIDIQGNIGFFAYAICPLLRNAARIRCGVAGISSMETPKA